MNARTQRKVIEGPAGDLECAIDEPLPSAEGAPGPRGLALVCHPHPLHGGTLDNKVVQTMARAFVQAGWRAVRFNFRGVGASGGAWDEGRGEVEDALAVMQSQRAPAQALLLAGFSFGAYVASRVGDRLAEGAAPLRTFLVGPAVANFEVARLPEGSLVIHGERDDVVPLAAVLDWARPLAQPVTVIPGAGHFFHGQLGLLKQLVLVACPHP